MIIFCPLCIRNPEAIDHLVMECPYTRAIWCNISDGVSLPRLHPRNWNAGITLHAWFGELSSALQQVKCKGAKSSIILVCWAVWCERNRRIFDRIEKDWGRLVSEI
jgi:hypothetical protein